MAAFRLELGRRGYYAASAIREYLEQLTRYGFFKYVVFVGGDGKFRGLVPAKMLLDQMRRGNFDVVRVIEDGSLNLVDGVVTATVASNSNKPPQTDGRRRAGGAACCRRGRPVPWHDRARQAYEQHRPGPCRQAVRRITEMSGTHWEAALAVFGEGV